MKIYKVIEKKLEENLGDSYVGYLYPSRSKRLRFMGLMLIVFIPLDLLLLYLVQWFGGLPFQIKSIILPLALLIVSGLLILYFLFRYQFFQEISKKMKVLVNDPELLWLNFKQNQVYPTGKKLVLKRSTYPLGDEAFHVMAHLKKQGTSSGLEWKYWKNSGTARKRLRQLTNRGIISESGSDYSYMPWEFRVIDEDGRFLETLHAKKVERLLNKAWERMIDENYPKRRNLR